MPCWCAPLHRLKVLAGGREGGADMIQDEIGVHRPTGEDVECGEAVFRPGVDAEVRLGQKQDARHTVGFELMETVGQDRRTAGPGGLQQQRSQWWRPLQDLGILDPEVEQDVASSLAHQFHRCQPWS